ELSAPEVAALLRAMQADPERDRKLPRRVEALAALVPPHGQIRTISSAIDDAPPRTLACLVGAPAPIGGLALQRWLPHATSESVAANNTLVRALPDPRAARLLFARPFREWSSCLLDAVWRHAAALAPILAEFPFAESDAVRAFALPPALLLPICEDEPAVFDQVVGGLARCRRHYARLGEHREVLARALADGTPIAGRIEGRVKGGYRVALGACIGFMPRSRWLASGLTGPDEGREIAVKVIKLRHAHRRPAVTVEPCSEGRDAVQLHAPDEPIADYGAMRRVVRFAAAWTRTRDQVWSILASPALGELRTLAYRELKAADPRSAFAWVHRSDWAHLVGPAQVDRVRPLQYGTLGVQGEADLSAALSSSIAAVRRAAEHVLAERPDALSKFGEEVRRLAAQQSTRALGILCRQGDERSARDAREQLVDLWKTGAWPQRAQALRVLVELEPTGSRHWRDVCESLLRTDPRDLPDPDARRCHRRIAGHAARALAACGDDDAKTRLLRVSLDPERESHAELLAADALLEDGRAAILR
ncbi:MAG: hypothetical protein AAF721_26010, partial [Myxococcota bacterium]